LASRHLFAGFVHRTSVGEFGCKLRGMYGLRGLGTISLAQAIFRQEGVVDASGNWVTGSLGYRLNNPGNLNYAGQPGASQSGQGNGSEAQFDTLADGIAATNAQLALDASRGLTLAQRLDTWATGNQAAYVANVSSWLGVDPNTPLSQLVGADSSALALVTPDSTVAPTDTGSVSDSADSVDTPVAGLSTTALLALGIAAVGIVWAVAS
jgi:hypothetical protein